MLVRMISKLHGLVGEGILISVGLILMQVYKLYPFIGGISLSLFSNAECIFVVSILTVNIGEQSMVLIYLAKMLRYVYLIMYMKMHGSIEESKKVIVNLHHLRMKKEREKTIKVKRTINKKRGNLLQIRDSSQNIYFKRFKRYY